jgi:nicotinic acetylcholine receptor
MKASWTYDGTQVNLLKNSDTGDVSNYIENGEWSLEELLVERNVKIYSCCPQPYPNVTYYVVIRRRPLFYVFNMIMPSLLITLVGFLIFLIPPDSGEKVGMGVTTLLSMTVFLMVVAENMPPNSDSVPVIAIYYFNSMLMISLATVAAVFTINVCRKGEEEVPVPEWLKIIFFDILAKLLFIKIKANRNLNQSVKEAFSDNKMNSSKIQQDQEESFIYNFDDYLEKTKNNPHLELWKANHDSIAKRLSAQSSPIVYNRSNLINNKAINNIIIIII